MVTRTSLVSKKCAFKIAIGLRDAIKNGVAHIPNKKGNAFLAVRYLTGETAWRVLGKSSGFWFLDKNGRDVTKSVLFVMQSVHINYLFF